MVMCGMLEPACTNSLDWLAMGGQPNSEEWHKGCPLPPVFSGLWKPALKKQRLDLAAHS